MDVDRLVAAWDELEAAKWEAREPHWEVVPGLSLEERVAVLELDLVLVSALLAGARAWEAEVGWPWIEGAP